MMAEVCIRQALIYFSFTCKRSRTDLEIRTDLGIFFEFANLLEKSKKSSILSFLRARNGLSRVLSRENSCMQARVHSKLTRAKSTTRQLSREQYIARLIPVEILVFALALIACLSFTFLHSGRT